MNHDVTKNPMVRAVVPPAGAILIGADAVWRIRSDGTAEELLPPGHPRPGLCHALARRRA